MGGCGINRTVASFEDEIRVRRRPSDAPRVRRLLVTGCAGFIGSTLVEALLGRGDAVIGVDGFTNTYTRTIKARNLAGFAAHPAFRFIELDLADDPISPLLEDVDGVFHLAARPGVRTSWGFTFGDYVRDNLLVTQRLFEESARAGVRIVYASSSSVYGAADAYPVSEEAALRPVSPYGVTKLACEKLASAYASATGLDAVGLRYFSVYGPRQRPDMAFSRIIQAALTGAPFTLLGGRQTRDFTYVRDVVDATLRAMELAPAGAIYNVGGGGEIALGDALALCERIGLGRVERDLRPVAAGDPVRTRADITRIGAELGWAPATSLEDGLCAQIQAAVGTPPRAPVRSSASA